MDPSGLTSLLGVFAAPDRIRCLASAGRPVRATRAHYRLEQLRAQQLHEERARQRDTESTAAFGVTRCERCGRVDAHDHGDSR
jgi:hypothetical protein